MQMIQPPFLQKEDTVAIVAPARWIDQNNYPTIISIIESYGLNVVRGNSTFLTHGPFAGTDQERMEDLQEMIDNPEVKAIFCLRGGYGTIRIIDGLNLGGLITNPKWIIGFSDITILHSALHHLKVMTIHGQMPLNFTGRTENKGLDTLMSTLLGESLSYSLESHELNRTGEAKGKLVGGNVAIFSSLIGTKYDIDTTGKILFIEEVGEYLYRFDRLMYHLKMSGKLNGLAGLIVGGLSDMKDNDPTFGQTVEQIINDVLPDEAYPVCYGFPAGHIKENYPLIFGKEISLSVAADGVRID